LAFDSSSFLTSSGMIPYFAGAKKALWAAIINTTPYRPFSSPKARAATASRATSPSTPLRVVIIRDLGRRSAREPAGAANSRNGMTKAAPAKAAMTPVLPAPWTLIRWKMISSLRKLSFRAPRNWVMLSLARLLGKVRSMGLSLSDNN